MIVLLLLMRMTIPSKWSLAQIKWYRKIIKNMMGTRFPEDHNCNSHRTAKNTSLFWNPKSQKQSGYTIIDPNNRNNGWLRCKVVQWFWARLRRPQAQAELSQKNTKHALQVQRFSKTRSFVKDKVLLDPFCPTETQSSSDKSSTNMLQTPQSWKTGALEIHPRFTVLEGLLEFLMVFN